MQAVPKARFGLVFLPPLVSKKDHQSGSYSYDPMDHTVAYTVDERTLKLKRNCSKFLFTWGEILNPYGVRVSVESVDLNCDLSLGARNGNALDAFSYFDFRASEESLTAYFRTVLEVGRHWQLITYLSGGLPDYQ